jgi:hypothetical protein
VEDVRQSGGGGHHKRKVAEDPMLLWTMTTCQEEVVACNGLPLSMTDLMLDNFIPLLILF